MYGYGRIGALGGSAAALGIAASQSWVIVAASIAIAVPALITRLFWRRRKSAFEA